MMNDGLRRKKEGKGGPPQSHEWGRRARGTTRESWTGGEEGSRYYPRELDRRGR